jgi:hypothetical protein
MPEGPHPLLCARRTFLASLLLAHKFTADKAFSNKAWARLTNLPAREVGRCERALGGVLGWRLWVGKPAEEPKTAALSRSASAPESYFEPADSKDIRMQEPVQQLSRGLSRAASEPSLGTSLPLVLIQDYRGLTYSHLAHSSDSDYIGQNRSAEASTSSMASDKVLASQQWPSRYNESQTYDREDEEAYGQRTIRVDDDDDDDESSTGSSMDFITANPTATILRNWPSQSSSSGNSSELSTPALSPASSVMSGSSSGSESGPDFASIPASWVPSSMKYCFTSEYSELHRYESGDWVAS